MDTLSTVKEELHSQQCKRWVKLERILPWIQAFLHHMKEKAEEYWGGGALSHGPLPSENAF